MRAYNGDDDCLKLYLKLSQRCFEKTKTSALNGGGNISLDTDTRWTKGNPAKYIERDTDLPQLPDEGSLHYG